MTRRRPTTSPRRPNCTAVEDEGEEVVRMTTLRMLLRLQNPPHQPPPLQQKLMATPTPQSAPQVM